MTVAGRDRPLIGVVAHEHLVPRPFADVPVVGAARAYATGVRAAGGRPVLLAGPDAADLVERVDALVLTGGGDVDPSRYGGDPRTAVDVDRGRDRDELRVVVAAADLRVPVLGVCRGMQLLAVGSGGLLADVTGHVCPGTGHVVETVAGSLIRSLLGASVRTSALHRQAVVDAGPSWRVGAHAQDGTVEAIEPATGDWPALGVQWHPEMAWSAGPDDATGPAVLGWLVQQARMRRLLCR